eukprot:scaffold4382_cov90-Isochrysis_galbana.AAC.1
MRAEVAALRAQHQELQSLCGQWSTAVQTLQHRPPPQAMYPPHAAYGAVAGYGAGPPAMGGHPGYGGGGGGAWTEHYSPEGHLYYYNATTGASSWERPADFGRGPGGGGGAPRAGGKTKGPPGANLFVAAKGQGPPMDDVLLRQVCGNPARGSHPLPPLPSLLAPLQPTV